MHRESAELCRRGGSWAQLEGTKGLILIFTLDKVLCSPIQTVVQAVKRLRKACMSKPAATNSSDLLQEGLSTSLVSWLRPASAVPPCSASFWSEGHWTPRKKVTLSIREWDLKPKTSILRFNLHQHYSTSIAAWKSLQSSYCFGFQFGVFFLTLLLVLSVYPTEHIIPVLGKHPLCS